MSRVKKNTITINGRVYDATTGVAVDHKPSTSKVAVKIPIKVASEPAQTEVVSKTISRQKTPLNARHAPEKSKTLRREVVKKPHVHVPTHAVSGLTSQPSKIVVGDAISTATNRPTMTHKKSPAISRFGQTQSVKKTIAHIPVAKAPSSSSASQRYSIKDTPPAPRHISANAPLKDIHRDLFEAAIQGASSHEAKKLKKQKHHYSRSLRIGASALSVLLLIAFYSYQNAPNIALKRASSKIGFNARIPGYSPAGYKLSGPVEYSFGKVKISFRSTTDSRSYNVTQTATAEDNETLASNFLIGKQYQKVSAGYIYDGSNIAWIKGGVLYNVVGNNQLSEDQLVNIASSL